MNNGLLLVGGLVLVASIFGYMYTQDQQGLLQQGQDALTGEQQDWSLLHAFSEAGIIAGTVLLIVGMMPKKREIDDSYR